MNRADRMLCVLALKPGGWFSRRDIFERVGYLMTNNAASELRAQGLTVEQRLHEGNYEYRYLPALGEAEVQPPASSSPSAEPETGGLAGAGCASSAPPRSVAATAEAVTGPSRQPSALTTVAGPVQQPLFEIVAARGAYSKDVAA